MKNILPLSLAIAAPLLFSQPAFSAFDYFKTDGSFKRFSVTAGWLHAAPQGKASPLQNTTAIIEGKDYGNGSVKVGTVKKILNPNQSDKAIKNIKTNLDLAGVLDGLKGDEGDLGKLGFSGTTKIEGLSNFASASGSGLQADDADTVGLLFNYYMSDNWSIEVKAGIPPKVDILGKGKVEAPLTGMVTASGLAGLLLPDGIGIKKDIPITDLEQGGGVASSARAWLPAAGVQYQFGKSGVNKFRPYVGAGVMYAYFNDIELNPGIRKDLEAAGHQIQNIKNNKAGAALEDIKSNREMSVDVEADSAFAPIITIGATYDFNDRWFSVASLSYAKLSSDTTITVKNDDGKELVRSVGALDVDPYITFLGLGYRF